MTLAYSPEHEDLRSSVRKFLAERAGSERLRATVESDEGFDRDLWKAMAQDLGLPGLAVAEDHGGSGFGFLEQAVVLEEMGRVVHASPYLASVVLAANLIALAGDARAQEAHLPGLASGDVVGTAALLDGAGVWGGPGADLALDRAAATVTGTASFVLEGAVADLVVALAADGDGRVLVVVPTDQAAVVATALPGLDTTRNLANVTFDGAAATVLCAGERVDEVLAEVECQALAALCAEMVGGAAKVLETTVEYAKIREQFGVPIGSFQAIKFKCADMLLQLEAARSASLYASNAVATGAEDRAVAAEVAKAVCSDAYFAIAAESVQIHGGIGFTWEHDTHLYFKRAKASELLLGNGDLHRERIATRLGW